MKPHPPRPDRSRALIMLAGFVIVTFAVSTVAGLSSQTGQDPWYQALTLPSFQPPSWAFGVVWPILYVMMAVSAWRVWYVAGNFQAARTELAVWAVQLVANLLWTFLFFSLNSIVGALVDIVLLWLLLVLTMVLFRRRDRLAAALLIPYLLWVSFAAALTYAILQLNPGA